MADEPSRGPRPGRSGRDHSRLTATAITTVGDLVFMPVLQEVRDGPQMLCRMPASGPVDPRRPARPRPQQVNKPTPAALRRRSRRQRSRKRGSRRAGNQCPDSEFWDAARPWPSHQPNNFCSPWAIRTAPRPTRNINGPDSQRVPRRPAARPLVVSIPANPPVPAGPAAGWT